MGELAHKLKGAAGGYGFPSISAAAATLEDSARAAEALDKLELEAHALVELCRRARATAPEVHDAERSGPKWHDWASTSRLLKRSEPRPADDADVQRGPQAGVDE